MKTKSFILFAISLVLSINIFGQEVSNNKFEKIKKKGGDVIINKSSIKIDGDNAYRIFEIEAPEAGDYYFSAFLLATNKKYGSRNYDIQVNDNFVKENIQPDKDNWQAIDLKDKAKKQKTIKLNKGINTIAFISNAPEIPEVESIVLSKDIIKATISDKSYNDYIKNLKAQKLPANYADIKKAAIATEKSGSKLKSYKLPNPSGNYDHEMDLDFGYTYTAVLYLTAGQTISLETRNTNTDPYMYLFNESAPMNRGSWSDDDGAGNGYNSKITSTIQFTGNYYILIRKYNSATCVSGTCDLYKDGNLYVSNVAVSGSMVSCNRDVREELNYFTKLISGDSRIWIEGYPGIIVAYNDDYYPPSRDDYQWVLGSRIKQNLNWLIGNTLVSNYSASDPIGKCDLYMNCKNSSVYGGSFPSLKSNDAIQSAPSTGNGPLSQGINYNCISWSGGRDNLGRYFWPSSGYDSQYNLNDWYDSNPQKAFDNFYGNVKSNGTSMQRWAGAPTYTRTGATADNAEIATWKDIYGDYQHGSVRKPGNNQPHGYDLESKIGGNERIFHPKNALANDYFYGNISDYYKRVGSLKSASTSNEGITFEESINRGLTTIEKVEFSLLEKQKVSNIKAKLTNFDTERFNALFSMLDSKSNSAEMLLFSNPIHIQRTKEYQDVLEFVKTKGDIAWSLLYTKVEDENELALMLLQEVSANSHGILMDEVKKENLANRYTQDGVYIAPSLKANGKKYVKKLLGYTDCNGKLKSAKELTDIVNLASDNIFTIYPNPIKDIVVIYFNNPKEQAIAVELYDVFGKKTGVLKQTQLYKSGNNSINLDLSTLKQGIYLCNVIADGNIFTYKLVKE